MACWGLVNGGEGAMKEPQKSAALVPEAKRVSREGWEELARLEKEHPYIFWSARVGKLKHLNDKDIEKIDGATTGVHKIKVRVAGQEIEVEKRIKNFKMAGNEEVYRQVKRSAGQRRNEKTEAMERIERDILDSLRAMLECHWEMASEKLVREEKWTKEERRKARAAYWDQRTWKRRRKKG
jgi:hypothetical protein